MSRGWVVIALVALGACRNDRVAGQSSQLQVEPASLSLSETWMGSETEAVLTLSNSAGRTLSVTPSVEAPFFIDTSALSVARGNPVTLKVTFRAVQPGEFAGTLKLEWDGEPLEVPLTGTAKTLPVCVSSNACRTSRFDLQAGKCVEDPAREGESCGAGNACLVAATCMAGECRGQPFNCSDNDACTADSCDPSSGCQHADISALCPASNDPCKVAACSASSGCGFADADDGKACGPNDCKTAQVCLSGACQSAVPPEGSTCAPAGVCSGPSVCHGNSCIASGPSAPKELWRYAIGGQNDAGPSPYFHFRGHMDDAGNVYLLFSDPNAGLTGVLYLMSIDPNGKARFSEAVPPNVYNLVLDETGPRVFLVGSTWAEARSSVDGTLLWRADLTVGLPAWDRSSDGGARFYGGKAILLGKDQIGFELSEGISNHHVYVRVYGRALGDWRWDLRRKGHIYGSGASGNGELWSSTADCWAPMGQLERSDPDGGLRASRFHSLQPIGYGADYAVGNIHSGSMDRTQVVTPNLMLNPLIGAPGLWAYEQVNTTGRLLMISQSALVEFDPATQQQRRSISLQGVGPIDNPFLTASGELLAMRNNGRALIGFGTDGGVTLQCPLPASVSSPLAVRHGRLVVQSGTDIVAYELPGYDVAPNGWIGDFGNLSRGNKAR